MSNRRGLAKPALVAALISVVLVHYLEEALLPYVELVRGIARIGDLHSAPAVPCRDLEPGSRWIHPTALALTVYGDATRALTEALGPHGTEVLPSYASHEAGIDELRCVADYLLSIAPVEEVENNLVRVYRFQIPQEKYGLTEGWRSGLTQGVVGQILLGAHLVTGSQRYLDAAREVGHLLAVDLDKGGVKVEVPDGVWFEEYAQSGATPPLVLNGHLLALDFLYRMRQLDNDPKWDALFNAGFQATVRHTEQYVGAVWSYYDRQQNLATRKYHSFHVRQLARYSGHDDSGTLGRLRDRMHWQLHTPLGVVYRLLVQPSRLLLFLVASFFLVSFPLLLWARRFVPRS